MKCQIVISELETERELREGGCEAISADGRVGHHYWVFKKERNGVKSSSFFTSPGQTPERSFLFIIFCMLIS